MKPEMLGSETVNLHLQPPWHVLPVLRCQIRGGAIHGDDLVVRTFARRAQQNGVREA
jgi:hypothetical protein